MNFSFCIGSKEEVEDYISTYTLHNREVFFGDGSDAELYRIDVSRKSPAKLWKIYKLEEYNVSSKR